MTRIDNLSGNGFLNSADRNPMRVTPVFRKPQILIVDDIQENRELLSRFLSRRGNDCTEAKGSGDAIKILTTRSFDLVLLDIMMPGMDGSEFMQVVRCKYSRSELPIIMVTAKNSNEDIRYNFGLGANDYIAKPIDWTVALPRIESQLNNKLEHDRNLQAYDEIEAEAGKLRLSVKKNSEMLVRFNQQLVLGSDADSLLCDQEVLEILLSNVVSRPSADAVAKELLSTFGDLNGVVAASERRHLALDGTTDRTYLLLKVVETVALRMARARVIDRCAIASWDDLLRYCKTVMAHRSTEQVRVLYLDRKNVLIADEAQGEGTVDHVPVYPREVVRRALELNASAVILVHNHPSGDPDPSEEDVAMTARIEEACRAVGVTLHDHLVIGKERDASLRAMGLM